MLAAVNQSCPSELVASRGYSTSLPVSGLTALKQNVLEVEGVPSCGKRLHCCRGRAGTGIQGESSAGAGAAGAAGALFGDTLRSGSAGGSLVGDGARILAAGMWVGIGARGGGVGLLPTGSRLRRMSARSCRMVLSRRARMGVPAGLVRTVRMSWRDAKIRSEGVASGRFTWCGNQARVSAMRSRWVCQIHVR